MSEQAHNLTPFEGGATRSSKEHRFDLIPREALEAGARRLALGAAIHGENNWKQGGTVFRRATVNHLLDHVYDYLAHGNANNANTDAIVANAMFLAFFEAQDAREADRLRSAAMLAHSRPGDTLQQVVRVNEDNGHTVLLTPLEPASYDVAVVDVRKLRNGKVEVTFSSNGVEMSETFTPKRAAKQAVKQSPKKTTKRK